MLIYTPCSGSTYRCLNLFVQPVFETVSAWFLSAPQSRDSILPEGPTVDLVTAAIFTCRLPPPPSIFLMLFQLQTFGMREISLTTHRVHIHIFLFHLPPASSCLSNQVFTLPRTLSNSNLPHWHDRGETCVAEGKYISYIPIF